MRQPGDWWLCFDAGTTDAEAREEAAAKLDVPEERVKELETEVKQLRGSLEAVLDEATSDLDRDIIITECQSALTR